MRSAIVLGGGMVGVASALHLQRRGWLVALVDRKRPGEETSYGNAGIIQSEALRPYPMPQDWRSLLSIATGRSNDVHYRLMSLPHHLGPLLRYWWHSFPERHDRVSVAYAQIIARAAEEHEDLIAAPGATFSVLTARELAQAEPGLIDAGAGGLHWQQPWTVSDPGALVAAYANLFVRLGGKLVRGNADTLTESHGGWAVTTNEGRIAAEAALVALGPWSPDLLKRFGYRFPMV